MLTITLGIHGTNGIFAYMNGWFFMVNVGKYTRPMDPMGYIPDLTVSCGLSLVKMEELQTITKTRGLSLPEFIQMGGCL